MMFAMEADRKLCFYRNGNFKSEDKNKIIRNFWSEVTMEE